MSESFTATLVSNQDDDRFANNTNYSFSNTLPRTIDLSNYEVALQSIYFTDKHTKPSAVTPPPPPKPFFDLDKKENEVTVILAKTASTRVSKISDDFEEFIKGIQASISEWELPFTLTPVKEQGVIKQLKINYFATSGWQLFLESPLERIFGFSNGILGIGEHLSDRALDIQFFKDLPTGSVAFLAEFAEDRTHVEIAQMNEKPDLEVLLGDISGQLLEQGHDVTFEVNKANSAVEFDVGSKTKHILLSPFLNQYIGQPLNFEFFGEGTIKVPWHIIFPSKQRTAPKSSSKLLVLCNIIKPQIYVEKELPLLALLDRKDTLSETEISYEPHVPIYKPVSVGKINHIGISIRDDKFNFIESQENPTVVNLHFRRMKDIFCDEKGTCKLINMDVSQPTEMPRDLIPIQLSRSSSPVRFVVRRKPIKAATKPKTVSNKTKPEGKGRPKKTAKKADKVVKRGRPPTVPKPQRGRPPTKSVKPKKK